MLPGRTPVWKGRMTAQPAFLFLKHETGGANSNTRRHWDSHVDSCNNKTMRHSKGGPETEQGQHEWDDERNGPSGLCHLDFQSFT